MGQLPDPTADLDWSGYVGSIQWHFSEAAKRHPERTCVIETKSAEAPERRFSYKQIYEASNTLAHYLHDAGVTNGDVVMIWAHRSVDLLVAIMGTLACSATMSVLDPAYPPGRQRIYLEVAQPRALVQIARATDDAGPLDAREVRAYIDEKLDLKAEIPAMRIGDDGTLCGGEVDGQDIFANFRSRSDSPPDTEVGPDSAPTLSFTSGSEGRPKGVLGRHFSLAKYFGWMADRFQLNADSKFTMLSGIAHDPIQRDIFTPLFLGAQLLVPSREDIQHEKLAEWMREHKPTVTHLTPAMGQILVGGATAKFPSLNRAFFVGDVLTKRDCKNLQDLAVNVNIVNMYGTTETSRAVSHFEIPSRAVDDKYIDNLKDTIPAGKGMQNVQLLVVPEKDRNRLCSIGEVGEIYVRAAGLAEGYKGDQTLNDQKFLMNWFVDNNRWVEIDKMNDKGEEWRRFYKGPRDRLYRTGDLGTYTESGDVECTGRADDQVKIRNYRVELNDIDSNLSQNILIRDCKTLAPADTKGIRFLVSYIVPELKEWPQWLEARGLEDIEDIGTDVGPTKVYFKRFRRMQEEVRDHLKARLADYAVPEIFIILKKLPLNPNGKVDKPNLPSPYVLTEHASDEELRRWLSMTETERVVATNWAELIHGRNAKTIRPQETFFELGGNSLSAQQMLLSIRKGTGTNISINRLYEYPSLAGFSRQIESNSGQRDGVNSNGVGPRPDTSAYTRSFDQLVHSLEVEYQTAKPEVIRTSEEIIVFLTGATGFLGAYIIKDVLERSKKAIRLIAHVRNVKGPKAAYKRLQQSLRGYGLWQDEWSARLSCVVGDLAQSQLGLDDQTWHMLCEKVDIVVHNGAVVHWVKTYQDMKATNVDSTIDAMNLCNTGKPKLFTFVSSTSVLDIDHYVKLSQQRISMGQHGVSEDDDLLASRTGLSTGYGQTKWVSEQLVRAAGERGLRGSIIRPGYILGDSKTGVCNTDDFLIRMLKGCVQLSSRPHIVNTVNAVPVDRVARIAVAAALNPLPNGQHVVHVTGHPRLNMSEFLSLLEHYGLNVPEISYDSWKDQLEKYVSAGGQEKDQEQHTLMPLYHFCVNDLPATTRAPELDDSNAIKILETDAKDCAGFEKTNGYGISKEDVGRYLRYLIDIKFIDQPSVEGQPLPEIGLSAAQMQSMGAVGGRGGSAR